MFKRKDPGAISIHYSSTLGQNMGRKEKGYVGYLTQIQSKILRNLR